jgi:hypothetical protein
MRSRKVLVLATVAIAGLTLQACTGFRQSVGLTKVTPDEFLTVSRAPLSVPPEYGLRPPVPGQPRPQDVTPELVARQIIAAERQSVTRSAGEQALASRVGAGTGQIDSTIRYVIDDQFGDIAHKEENWANRVMFWRREDPATQTETRMLTADGVVPIDAYSEYERLQALTGGQNAIVITPRRSAGFKIPGL